jgi:hypothetical protein
VLRHVVKRCLVFYFAASCGKIKDCMGVFFNFKKNITSAHALAAIAAKACAETAVYVCVNKNNGFQGQTA